MMIGLRFHRIIIKSYYYYVIYRLFKIVMLLRVDDNAFKKHLVMKVGIDNVEKSCLIVHITVVC